LPAGWARMAVPSCDQVCTGLPPIAMILSLALIPAVLAGALPWLFLHEPWLSAFTLAGTQLATEPIVVVLAFAIPIPSARMISSTNASAKCMNEPATMTIARCQRGLFRIARGSSAGSTSSKVVIPVIRTKAPKGRALTPYSVSPRLVDHRVCPNPMKN